MGRTYQFCWQCMREWEGPGPRSDHCGNPGCTNPDIEKLAKCRDIKLPAVNNVSCPSMRACPTCGNLVEHDTTGCKNIICNRCRVEFCFVCLKVTKTCLQTSRHFIGCSAGVAPRQTSITIWNRSENNWRSQAKWHVKGYIKMFHSLCVINKLWFSAKIKYVRWRCSVFV